LGREGAPAQLGGGSYTLGEILNAGWAGFTNKIGIGLGVVLIFLVIHLIGSNVPFLNLLYLILAQFPLQAGLALVGIKLGDAGLGRDSVIEVGDLFAGFSRYGSTMGAGWLLAAILLVPAGIVVGLLGLIGNAIGGDTAAVAMAIGIILLLVPVIYVGLRLFFIFYLIMDQQMGAIESIQQSWAITHGHVLNLFVLALVMGGAMIAGTLLLIVGVFPAMVFAMATYGAAYRKISNT
jgi:uncharacterized membrane protein